MPESLEIDGDAAAGAAVAGLIALTATLIQAGVLSDTQVRSAMRSAAVLCQEGSNEEGAALLSHIFHLGSDDLTQHDLGAPLH